MSSGSLLVPKEEQLTTPEATSPSIAPMLQTRDFGRNEFADGSPFAGHNYTTRGNLFVVNPSAIPRDSPIVFQCNQADTKNITKFGGDVNIQAIGPSELNQNETRRGPGYRGSSGVFPTVAAASFMGANRGALVPQIRPAGTETRRDLPAFSQPTTPQIRSTVNWSKQALQSTVRSLGISQPIMTIDQDPQTFARMQTIDLATAASNERKRREAAARRSRLVANRPAPHLPTLNGQDALRNIISVKRKQPPSRPQAPKPTIQSSSASGYSLDVNGSTTSASLSPGREEVRRRSPRNAESFNEKFSAKELRSLQRKQTIGLPSKPRSQRIIMAREAGSAREQTVMFMSDIVYDHPGVVKTIINRAPEIYAASKRQDMSEKSPLGSYETTLRSSGSIIHRSWPVRRDTKQDRALFTSEPSPGHKRSKSGSSITTRKSILRLHPGSPTQLPPLPAPPTNAAKLTRILQNNTKSMTFDERIELLFPAPPRPAQIRNRRSSVPLLPSMPSVFMSDVATLRSAAEEERERRASKRSTIASFGSQDFQLPFEINKNASKERQTYRFSANTYRTLADEVGETWIPGITPTKIDTQHSTQRLDVWEARIYDTRKSAFTDTSATNSSTQDDDTIYWGSVHSGAPAVDLTGARSNARPTVVQHGGKVVQVNDSWERELPLIPQIDCNDGEDIIRVMFHHDEHPSPPGNRQSFFLDADQSKPRDKTPSLRRGAAWHRRIGDELPTFSERISERRKHSSKARKMPPPTPLLLKSRGQNATIIIRTPEPSPINSEEAAIKEIQARLNRFEEPSRGSINSLIRRVPDGVNKRSESENNLEDQFKLLENLEREMGQQENQWQQMQTNLDRDSMSTIATPQRTALSLKSSPMSLRRSSRTPSQASSRRSRIRSGMSLRSKSQDCASSSSTNSSDYSRASTWQQRLAEAQMEYLENAPALLRKRSANFLSVSIAQLGSLTPPDSITSGTDSDSELEVDSESEQLQQTNAAKAKLADLWQAPLVSPKAAVGCMWNSLYEVSTAVAPAEPPAKNIRQKQGQIQPPLTISSRELWSKPSSPANSRPVVGLWGSRLVRPRSIVTRRGTQRPQRKSKRMTFLPDIGMY